jgi:hypothetical protein
MINERIETMNYLQGKNFDDRKCTWRMCVLMATYFYEQGQSAIEIRKSLYKWGHDYNVYITFNVNHAIQNVMEEDRHLFDSSIYISDQEVEEIVSRFSSKNVKKCALAILLLAKVYADEDGFFTFNQKDFAKWVGIKQPHVSEIFDELVTMEYIIRERPGDNYFVWNGNSNTGRRIRYKMNFDYWHNSGGKEIKDTDDIDEIFGIVFSEND